MNYPDPWKTERPRVVAAFWSNDWTAQDEHGDPGVERPTTVLGDGSWWQWHVEAHKWHQLAHTMTDQNMVPLEAPKGEE